MEKTGETNKRPRKASVQFWLGGIAAAVAILIPVLAFVAIQFPAVQKQVIQFGAERIEDATRLKIRFEPSTWRLMSSLHLTDVMISADDRRVLDCGEVGIDYSLTLKWPYVNLEQIYLEKPFLRLERNTDGKWIIPLGKAAGKGGGGGLHWSGPKWPGSVPVVRISSGTIEGRKEGQVILSVKEVTGELRLKVVNGPGGQEIQIDLENMQAKYGTDSEEDDEGNRG